MLKNLVIVAVLMTFGQASQLAPHHTAKAAAQRRGKSPSPGDKNQPDDSPKLATAQAAEQVEAAQPKTSQATTADKEHSVRITGLPPITLADKQKTFRDSVLEWGPWFANLFLVIVGGLQVLLLWRTWKTIGRQADTMDKQAADSAKSSTDAALVSAQTLTAIKRQADLMELQAAHMGDQTAILRDSVAVAQQNTAITLQQMRMTVDKERARLEVGIERTELRAEYIDDDFIHLIAKLTIRNFGATRALIRRSSGVLITTIHNEVLKEPDEYTVLDLPDQFVDPNIPIIPVKLYLHPSGISVQDFANGLENGTFSVHIFGFIEYETLGLRWRIEFGYDWMVVDRRIGDIYGLSDPYPNSPRPAKDRITYGLWQQNMEKTKPERQIEREGDQKAI